MPDLECNLLSIKELKASEKLLAAVWETYQQELPFKKKTKGRFRFLKASFPHQVSEILLVTFLTGWLVIWVI